MTPKAEVWVPEGVSKEKLKNLLSPVDGRINKFQESKPIPVGEISPSSMAAFLEESHLSFLGFDPNPTYPAIFSKLRKLPLDEQKELLVGFYSKGVEAFPNGKELGIFLARINNIRWFQPEIQPDEELLESLCRQTLSRLDLPDLPLRIIKEARGTEWSSTRVRDAAQDAAWGAARGRGAALNAVWGATLGAVWDMVRSAALDTAQNAAWGAVWGAEWDAVRGAEWIAVKDLMPQKGYKKGNPFEPLMEIYELGCWPIGVVPDQNGKKEFVVFIPPVQETS